MSDVSEIQPRSVSPALAAAPLGVEIFDTLQGAEAIWRSLEERAVATPYQRFDWINALLAAGAEKNSRVLVAVITRNERPVALLPLGLRKHRGLTEAHMLGAEQSNADWLIAEPGFSPSKAELHRIFALVSQAAGGIDLLSLSNLPQTWQGHDNPLLVLDHAPAPSNLYTAVIGPTPVPYIDHRLSTKRRSNINRGRRRLAEQHGEVRMVHVRDDQMLAQVHQAFLDQRGARFAEMGISNMFAQAPFYQLFRDLTRAGFGSERPTLCLHALYAGDEIVATSWGLQSSTHYSQYINSTTSGAAARYSLMGILISELMDALTVQGITTFDMGLGDFDYKTEWTKSEPVFNSVLPLTLKGRIAARARTQLSAGKRLIKQTPALWQTAQHIRRALFKLRNRH
ncbi:GNAT family N-acetyltransferase [Devosia submarina]|uniref:GNAT family N-acetyltransferase n=1 Tax=Devosia submarina TaxID=1173082 RepID=UPI000D391C89|nr:GNAT family N-acetyltransferase [Devosia submarina]